MATVMVVDDAVIDRRLAGELLEKTPNLTVCYAHDGDEALVKVGQEMPDLVLTDLQMPNLNGLELVKVLRDRYPQIPVVLMTAHGSETIAAQAIAYGAASFVPKAELSANLVETVMHILAMTHSDQRYKTLIESATRTEFEFRLKNDLGLIDPLIDLIQQLVESQGLLDSSASIRVGVAVEHALTNAMFRGNLEMSRAEYAVIRHVDVAERAEVPAFAERRVFFRLVVTPEAGRIMIQDDGPGFDCSSLPAASDPESFRDGKGRGLVLMQAFMDDIEFSSDGRCVKMAKYRGGIPRQPR